MCPAQDGHHGDVELLQDVRRGLPGVQLAPAHGQALGALGQQLALLRELGHCHLGVEVGRPFQLGVNKGRGQ